MLSNSARYKNQSYATEYGSFKGVDFTSPMNDVDACHSPDALNVMVGPDGSLNKRPGFEFIGCTNTTNRDEIFGIYCGQNKSGTEVVYIHGGKKLWRYRMTANRIEDATVISQNMPRGKSRGIQYGKFMLILTGERYIVADIETDAVIDPHLMGYIPTIIVNADPATGSGTTFEAVNDLCGARTVSYIGDGTTTDYYLTEKYYKVLYAEQYEDGDWQDVTYRVYDDEADKQAKRVRFVQAPPAPTVTGQPSVRIMYQICPEEEYYKNSKVAKCKYFGTCGVGGNGSDRVFFAGSEEYPNVDWHTDIVSDERSMEMFNLNGLYPNIYTPFYVPDTSYATVGSDSAPIAGYAKIGEYQVILKQYSANDAAVYLRYGNVDEDGNVFFSLETGIAGFGVEAPGSIANFIDEPVFLTKGNGVCGISLSDIKRQACVVNRSWYIDGKLKKSVDMNSACSCVFNGYYLLAVDDVIYVLDGRQNRSYKAHSGGYVYEGYLWHSPYFTPSVMCATRETVIMGDERGILAFMKFHIPEDNPTRYSDFEYVP